MRPSTLEDYRARMLRVLVHIQQNLDEALSLERLAEVASFSPFHFHRIFRGMLGESVKAHIRRLRLERAAMRLKQGRLPVTDIAFEAGYETHEAFTRAFKTWSGLAPSRYRNSVHFDEDGRLDTFEPGTPGGEDMEVEIKTLEPRRVAFVRHVGPYDRCGEAWEKLMPALGSRGFIGADTQLIGLCHDDPEVTPPDKVRYDACATVDQSFEPEGEIGVQTIAGGDYAVTTHIGPYNKVGPVYARLYGEWLPRSGREARSAPALEVYLNDPEGTEPEDLVTDIHAPLEPR